MGAFENNEINKPERLIEQTTSRLCDQTWFFECWRQIPRQDAWFPCVRLPDRCYKEVC